MAYELHYTVYGRDGVMGELEPLKRQPAHELCILVQGVAPTARDGRGGLHDRHAQMFYARLPDVKGSAASVAFALDEVLRASPAHGGRSITPCAASIPWSCSRPGWWKSDEALRKLAKTVRSKNAGVDLITFDIIFRDREPYETGETGRILTVKPWRSSTAWRRSGSWTSSSSIRPFAIKFTITRLRPSGSPGDRTSSARSNTRRCSTSDRNNARLVERDLALGGDLLQLRQVLLQACRNRRGASATGRAPSGSRRRAARATRRFR
jgi:hypothetical protein